MLSDSFMNYKPNRFSIAPIQKYKDQNFWNYYPECAKECKDEICDINKFGYCDVDKNGNLILNQGKIKNQIIKCNDSTDSTDSTESTKPIENIPKNPKIGPKFLLKNINNKSI